MRTKPLIAITMGDPSGIGPEIIVKALQSAEIADICVPMVIGDRLALERAVAVCSSSLIIHCVASAEAARNAPESTIPLLAFSHLTEADMPYGAPSITAGDAVYRYICHATQLCRDGQVAAMATAPISKEAMHRAGHDYPGHTELLAELCGTNDFVMMLAGDLLRVSLV
ncbi:MAG: 4-hydroxythreonine-4-phosphate dehydrogenase PdxA, partial [Opitutaceae bacterium]